MKDNRLTTPVVFFLFNRPETTKQTFARIAEVKPTQLFLVADAQRPNHPTDAANCAAARAIVQRVDWDCDVHYDFADENMGCRRRIASGLDWVFDQVETAIILEDDVLADHTFFRFAHEMLQHHLDDKRVMQIAGYNPVPPRSYPYSYYYSYWGYSWGWATWRRAWQCYYDIDMKLWSPTLRDELAQHPSLNPRILGLLEQTHAGQIDTWDYQWFLARILQSGLNVVPARNLVRNIGFDSTATHTNDPRNPHAQARSGSMEFPLVHSPWTMIYPSFEAELDKIHNAVPLKHKVKVLVERLLGTVGLGLPVKA
jgi:hypothetical protein